IAALQQVYGKSLQSIESELQAYIRGDRFAHIVTKLKVEESKENFAAESANAFDVKLAEADLLNRSATEAEAKKRFETLTVEDPKRFEPWAGLAYIELHLRNTPKALENFAKAFDLGARGNRLLIDYASLQLSNRQ